MDQDDARAMTVRSHMEKIVERAYLPNRDLLAGFLAAPRFFAFALFLAKRVGLQQAKVRMIGLRQPATGRARATGFTGRKCAFAEQGFGETARQVELADAALAG